MSEVRGPPDGSRLRRFAPARRGNRHRHGGRDQPPPAALREPNADRGRRHGRDLRRRATRPSAGRSRSSSSAEPLRARRGGAAPLHARGARRGAALRPPAHRHDLRRRRGGRAAVHRHGVPVRRDARRSRGARGRIAHDDALRWLGQAADALDEAHRHGVVHRDVKPANLLLDERDSLHVGDFGIARVVDETTTGMTMAGTVLGTAGYLSPEQARGEPATPASRHLRARRRRVRAPDRAAGRSRAARRPRRPRRTCTSPCRPRPSAASGSRRGRPRPRAGARQGSRRAVRDRDGVRGRPARGARAAASRRRSSRRPLRPPSDARDASAGRPPPPGGPRSASRRRSWRAARRSACSLAGAAIAGIALAASTSDDGGGNAAPRRPTPRRSR